MTLEQVLETFRNDKNWNTVNKDGSHRFDEKIKWIEEIVKEYAEYFHLTVDEIITKMEKREHIHGPITIKKQILIKFLNLEN